ncbi:MAG TPA: hypothetical protein VKD21_09715 [Acidimicrobiales bacterium]|nr:hypothetical protein [Acidimicrobiales bacterium]
MPLEESSDGLDRRLVTRVVIGVLVVVLAILFVVQNSDRVQTTFVFFDVTTRLWVGLVVALVLGALLGQVVEALWARRKRRKAAS